ncbi:MAG: hypothetical protein U9N35_03350 [Euryarchaeota archaeon]|nr:hypothetical protein [Euryarchaeota archaeon]
MTVLGVRMKKIEATRDESITPEGPVKIAPSQKITNIKENKIDSASGKATVVEFDFEFAINYDPPMGEIRLKGKVIYHGPEKVRKEIIKTWKDSKRISKTVEREILANLTSRAFLVAMNSAREIGVPSPMPFKFGENAAT